MPAPKRQRTPEPVAEARKNGYKHWPAKAEKRGQCKACPKNFTTTICVKCDVRLCFTEGRNCYTEYHYSEDFI